MREWLTTKEGKKSKKEFFKKKDDDKVSDDGSKKRTADGKQGNGNWKKKFKKALRTEKGLKTVMSILASEEKSNKAFVAAFTSALPHSSESKCKGNKVTVSALESSIPATSLKLRTIMRKNVKESDEE